MIDVPAAVRKHAGAVDAERWLDELPDIVTGLERDWSIVVGRSFADATEAFVAEAALADGTPVVRKVLVPRAEVAVNEIDLQPAAREMLAAADHIAEEEWT